MDSKGITPPIPLHTCWIMSIQFAITHQKSMVALGNPLSKLYKWRSLGRPLPQKKPIESLIRNKTSRTKGARGPQIKQAGRSGCCFHALCKKVASTPAGKKRMRTVSNSPSCATSLRFHIGEEKCWRVFILILRRSRCALRKPALRSSSTWSASVWRRGNGPWPTQLLHYLW